MMERVVDADLQLQGSGFTWRRWGFKFGPNWLEFRFKRSLKNRPRSSHDRPRLTTIERRSCSKFFGTVDRWSWSGFHAAGAPIAARSHRDRGSIAPRSRFDRTAIVVFFHESSGPSDLRSLLDEDPMCQSVPRGFTEADRSRSRDFPLMTIRRSSRRHVASGKPFDHFT